MSALARLERFGEKDNFFQKMKIMQSLFTKWMGFSDKMPLQKLSDHLDPIVIFARVLLKSLFEPLFISQLHKCSSCFAWKGHTLTRPNRSQELGLADIILIWVGQICKLDIEHMDYISLPQRQTISTKGVFSSFRKKNLLNSFFGWTEIKIIPCIYFFLC